jgi:hypothetical protein
MSEKKKESKDWKEIAGWEKTTAEELRSLGGRFILTMNFIEITADEPEYCHCIEHEDTGEKLMKCTLKPEFESEGTYWRKSNG